MNKVEIANELFKSANDNGLIATLYSVFGNYLKVSVPFSKRACDTTIDELDFSVRANNSLKRAGLFTIGEVIDIISNQELSRIRNLGKKTENEIKTRLLVFGYEFLTENEKKLFLYDVVEKNCIRYGKGDSCID